MGKRITQYIKYLIQCFLSIVYPEEEFCLSCGRLTKDEEVLCESCLNSIVKCKSSFFINHENKKLTCYSANYYSKEFKEIVLKFKYKSDFSCGRFMAKSMVESILHMGIKADLICFVPISKESYKKRGFNQAEFLAKEIGKELKIEVIDCLCRVKRTWEQKYLDTNERWNNLKECFKINEEYIEVLSGKNIMLIDDVVTTGATLFFCAEEFIKLDINNIILLTAAKSRI